MVSSLFKIYFSISPRMGLLLLYGNLFGNYLLAVANFYQVNSVAQIARVYFQ